jgi:hypothetical protein
MVVANPLWRAPRIHGERKMLGIALSERTVSRILRRLRQPPTPTWKTFLHNHLKQCVSIDFFTVPTITRKVLFVFIVLEHRRRQMLHFNVREHPTAAWTSQPIVEAFLDRDALRYLMRDRDSIYGDDVRRRISSIGHRRTTHRAAESLAESVCRTPDRLDTRRLLEPFRYPEREASEASPGFLFRLPWFPDPLGARPAMSIPRQVSSIGRIIAIPQLGGLPHRYERVAA